MVMSSNAMKSHNLRGMMDLILKKTRGFGAGAEVRVAVNKSVRSA